MPDSDHEFGALLEQVRTGDEAAVARLVQRYEGIILRAVRGLLGPVMRPYLDSVDVVQSVHRSLLIGLRFGKFDVSSPEKLIALAMTMVRRKVARNWRRLNRQNPLGPGEMNRRESAEGLDLVKISEETPAEKVEFQDKLDHLLNELQPVDRRLVELRMQGHSTAEVARLLGVDSRLLRVRLGRLRKRLRDLGLLEDWL